MEIDYKALSDLLRVYDRRIELVNYIYRRQGFAPARLDYNAAAAALEVDRGTISNYVNQLGRINVIKFTGGELYISPVLAKQRG